MNIAMMNEVVRISDRFVDSKDPDSIDRQGSLSSVLVVVFIFHAVMGIAFVQMEEYERRHPRIIHDVDVQFEIQAPPPIATFKVGEVPKPISLTVGENPNPGSASAAKPLETQKVSLPTLKAPETQPTPTPEAARPTVSHRTTIAPPVSVTPTSTVKAAPLRMTAAPAPPMQNPIAGITSNTQASGAPQAGGAPEGKEGSAGPGGAGTGTGSGTGVGDPGTGTGFGTAGGEIATILPTTSQRAQGNIAPYRKKMLGLIAQKWQPKKKYGNIVVLAEIARDGKLLRAEIVSGSGNKKADREALDAIEATEYEQLPDWYKGESIPFRIELARVEALRP